MANRCHVFTENWDGTERACLNEKGHVRGLRFSHADPGGPLACSFTLDADPTDTPAYLRPGRKLTVRLGSNVWVGTTSGPERGNPWRVQADGPASDGRKFRATGTNPYALSVSLPAAVTRGLRWTIPSGLPTGDGDGRTDVLPSLSVRDVLDSVAGGVTKTWWVDMSMNLHVGVPPLTPSVMFTSHTPAGGRVLASYVTAYHVTYLSSTTGANVQTFVRATDTEAVFPVVEEPLDLTSKGAMSSAVASAVASARLALYGPRIPWAGQFTFGAGQVQTISGGPVDLATVRPPIMGRLIQTDPDHAAELNYSAMTDLRVGVSEYDDDLDSLTITPYDVDKTAVAKAVIGVFR